MPKHYALQVLYKYPKQTGWHESGHPPQPLSEVVGLIADWERSEDKRGFAIVTFTLVPVELLPVVSAPADIKPPDG